MAAAPLHPVRIVAVTLGAAVLCFLAGGAMAFFGVASESWGWAVSGLVFALVLGSAVLLLKPDGRRWLFAVAAAVALVLGFALWSAVPPSPDRVRAVSDEIEVPATWTVESVEARGNTWCFKGCPHVTSVYTVPGDPDAEVDAFLDSLEAQGWSPATPFNSWERMTRGRWTVKVYARTDAPVVSVIVE